MCAFGPVHVWRHAYTHYFRKKHHTPIDFIFNIIIDNITPKMHYLCSKLACDLSV